MMKVIVFLLVAATLASASSRTIFHGNKKKDGQSAPSCTHEIHRVESNTTGEIIDGAACIQTPVNALRYNTVINLTVSEVQGKDIFASLTPPAPIKVDNTPPENSSQVKSDMEAAHTSNLKALAFTTKPQAEDPIEDSFRKTQKVIDDVTTLLATNQKQARDAQTKIAHQLAVLRFTIENSDAVLAGGADNLIKKAQADIASFDEVKWPPLEDTLDKINTSTQQLDALHQVPGWTDWYSKNNKEYDATVQKVAIQNTAALAIAPASDAYKTAALQIAVIQQWTQFINALTEKMFLAAEDVPCGTLFNVSRNNTLQLSQTDRLPTLDLKDPTTSTVSNWVIVRCSNPFSISAGMIFSFVADNEFGIVAAKGPNDMNGKPTTVNEFQRTATSEVPKLPIALAHVRLAEWCDKKFAFHGSFGVAAHSRSSSQGGSDPEYLFGGSISLLRTMFITGGPYWATRVNLGGGFSEGDIVPTGVTAPPLQKQGVRGWAVAISFTKP